MSTEVQLGTLQSIAGSLRSGGEAVERIASGAPSSVDAGELTGLVTSLLADLLECAATSVEGMNNAATAVSEAHETYGAVDAATSATMRSHRPAGPV